VPSRAEELSRCGLLGLRVREDVRFALVARLLRDGRATIARPYVP